MKSLPKAIPLIGIFFMCLTSFLAILSEFSENEAMPFDNYDRDSNGLISKQEFIQVNNEHFEAIIAQGYSLGDTGNAPSFLAIDKDKDGQLSENEFNVSQQLKWGYRRGTYSEVSNLRQERGYETSIENRESLRFL